MRPDLVALLRCPHCGDNLQVDVRILRCTRGHCFDIARQGYVNLLPGDAGASTADNPAMVAARESFLAAGHFARLRALVAETVATYLRPATVGTGTASTAGAGRVEGGAGDPGMAEGMQPDAPLVVDAGAGTGYYLAAVLDRLPEARGMALDLSKHALRRAARAHDRAGAVVCDVWKTLPLGDSCAAAVLDVFAPRNPKEFQRVLKPAGVLLVVTPTPRHLQELVKGFGLLTVDPRKAERIDESLADFFHRCGTTGHEETLRLTHAEALTLMMMGPSARHIDEGYLAARLAGGPSLLTVTVSVDMTAYRCA